MEVVRSKMGTSPSSRLCRAVLKSHATLGGRKSLAVAFLVLLPPNCSAKILMIDPIGDNKLRVRIYRATPP